MIIIIIIIIIITILFVALPKFYLLEFTSHFLLINNILTMIFFYLGCGLYLGLLDVRNAVVHAD